MEDQELTPQDEHYLNSPGFESYMAAGFVFAFGLGISLIGSIVIEQEPLFWPGMLLSMVVAFVVLRTMKQREYRAKMREIRENPRPHIRRPTSQ